MDTYLVTSGPWRVFRYSGDVAPEKLDSALSFADSLSTNIRSRDDHEIPIGPGFCIDQGFIAGSDYRSEGRCCINQGRGEAVLTFTRNDMAVTL